MVLSKINDKVSYKELKTIDENDKGRDVSMYQINLFKIPIVIALGEIKFTFIDEKILFTPVYLVVDESNKIYQIGVYEFPAEKLENLKDDDGDLDISLIDGPLLYSFIDKLYIKKCMKNETFVHDEDSGDDEEDGESSSKKDDDDDSMVELSDDEEDGEDDEETGDEGKDVKKGFKNPPPVLVELNIEDYEDDDDFLQKGEDEKDQKRELKKYKAPGKSESQWIEMYMNNNNYGIKDNPGHGDCFFYTIRDAFKSININASVKKIRDLLTERVDGKILNNYKERYDMINTEIKTLLRQIPNDKTLKSKIRKNYNKLAKESQKEKDIPTKKRKKNEAKKLLKKHKDLSENIKRKERELVAAKRNYQDIKWFKNITTVEQLKKKMRTCNYWADIWAISTLEIALNTKFIILSSNEFKKGRTSSVLKCGDFVPTEIEKKKYFKPKYYIVIEHTGNHYKLITYKDKEIYRFHQIPYGLKRQIVEKCMKSKGKSLFNYIPKFAKLIGEKIEIPVEGKKEKIDTPVIVVETETDIDEDPEEEVVMQTPTPEDENLFNDDTVFYFHSGSANKKPGKAIGKTIQEKIKDEDISKFKELEKIKDWRKVLSNFYTKPKEDEKVVPLFELDGLKWASVEHYYHANKFKKNNPDFYRLFAINSGSQIMDDPKKALGAGGKTGRIKGKQFRPREIVMDEDFEDGKNKEIVMEKGQQAKFEQDELAKQVLLATKDAKLVHYIKSRGTPKDPVVFYDTMRIRHRLKKKN